MTPATHERVNRRPGNARARDLRGVFGWSRPFGPGVLPGEIVDLMAAAGVLERDGDSWRSRVPVLVLRRRAVRALGVPDDGA